jgi:hypothetical protein
VDYIQLRHHSVQWPSFAEAIVSFRYHTREGLRGHVSYRGGQCAWSLVVKLFGWSFISLLNYFQGSFGHNTDKILTTNEFRDSAFG